MSNFWSVHQILKPILGPSSSHSSAPLVMGYLYGLALKSQGLYSSNLDDILNRLKISIYCHNPSQEMYAFVGHRSIRALLMGLLGGYFSPDKHKIFEQAKEKLANTKEYDLLHGANINFYPLKKSGVAYIVELEFFDYKAEFGSVGGGVISIDNFDENMEEAVSKMERETVPVWLYLSYETLQRFEHVLPFEIQNLDKSAKILEEGDEFFLKRTIRGSLWREVMELEKENIKNTWEIMETIWEFMERETENRPREFRYSKFLKLETPKAIKGSDYLSKLMRYTLNVAINNAEMNFVISAPTGGASSILPAVLRASLEEYKFSREETVGALYTAGLIGAIVGNNMSVSGSQHGCQAEIGTSMAMASAALIDLLYEGSEKERARKIFDGASIALQSIQGLACDPVMGFVEVPCVLRNLVLASTPLMVTKMILSGYRPIITLRTAIRALRKTGELLNKALRESGTGPLTCMYILSRMEEKGIEEDLIELFEREIYW